MSLFDELLEANEAFAANFDKGHLAAPPARRLAVVTCMDSRIHPEKSLGLADGDAHIIRNAGGRAQEALRSLVISQRLLGTNEIVVLHHTDCGMVLFTNQQLADRIQAELGVDVQGMDFLPFSDLEQSVRDDVAFLRASPLIPKDIPISGAIYDVRTGKVHEIVRA
jgi:carbonic anhydrase